MTGAFRIRRGRASHKPPRLSEIELCAWIAQAEPGAILEYHRGYLALDRTSFGRFADGPARASLSVLGARAHDLAERGLQIVVSYDHDTLRRAGNQPTRPPSSRSSDAATETSDTRSRSRRNCRAASRTSADTGSPVRRR